MHTAAVRRSLTLLCSFALVHCRPGEATLTTTPQPARTSGAAVAPDAGPSAVADAATAPPPARDALALVRARAEGLERTRAQVAAWFPMQMLAIIERTTRGLAALSAPQFNGDLVLWSVALPAAETTLDADARDAVCTEAQRAEPRVLCETDAVEIRGVERARWVFAWKVDGAPPRANLATPLRALARAGGSVCLRSIERTLHTAEIAISAPDIAALGRTLALMSAAPRMSELVLVRTENRRTELYAELSWPTDRADRSTGELEGDAWPTRCDGASHVLQDDATSLRALFTLGGTTTRGAVVERASRQWVVTVGDRVGDAEIIAIDERALRVRRTVRGRPRELELRWEGGGPDAATDRRPPLILPTDPARGLPPGVRP
jgi:hypothetical protein